MARQMLPSVAGWQVQTKLRRAREELGRKRETAARALDWSVSKILRIENGNVRLTTTDAMALSRYYAFSDEETAELISLVRISRLPTLSDEFSDVLTKEFGRLLDFEMTARIVRQYEPKFIPGVLQNNGYATSIIAALNEGDPLRVVDRKVQARQLRAEQLLAADGPEMFFIIDEATLRRGVGNESAKQDFSVMLRLFERLKRLNTVGRAQNGEVLEDDRNANVSIQIMPFSYGAYSALRGPFEILEFEPDQGYLLYQETTIGDIVNENPGAEITSYLETFLMLQEKASPARDTNKFIDGIAEEIKRIIAARDVT